MPDIWAVVQARKESTSLSVSDYGRAYRWWWSFEYFVNNPLGVGWTIIPLNRVEHAHNDMLIMGMSFGISGFIGYILALAGEMRRITINIIDKYNNNINSMLPSLSCLIALIICGFMDMILAIGYISDIAWIIVLLSYGNSNKTAIIYRNVRTVSNNISNTSSVHYKQTTL